jgi:hypothetical protein
MRWGMRKTGELGWKATVYLHHDHSPYRRFEPVVICGCCNAMDAHAKEATKAPAWFSFSPAEMRAFIRHAHANGPLDADFDEAQSVLDQALDELSQPLVDGFYQAGYVPIEMSPRDDGDWVFEPISTLKF